MKINSTQCENCKQVLVSVSRHDFTRCQCGLTAIDGGFDYNKVVGSAGRRINTTDELFYVVAETQSPWVAALVLKLASKVVIDEEAMAKLEESLYSINRS
jgi:hypothetical protein